MVLSGKWNKGRCECRCVHARSKVTHYITEIECMQAEKEKMSNGQTRACVCEMHTHLKNTYWRCVHIHLLHTPTDTQVEMIWTQTTHSAQQFFFAVISHKCYPTVQQKGRVACCSKPCCIASLSAATWKERKVWVSGRVGFSSKDRGFPSHTRVNRLILKLFYINKF